MTAAAQLVGDALDGGGPGSIAVLGGARGTNEDAFAWARLADALGITHRDAQLGDGLPAEAARPFRGRPSTRPPRRARSILLGPDLKEELPVLYLRLRHAAEQRTVKLLELGPTATGLARTPGAACASRPARVDAVTAALADHESRRPARAGPVVVVAGRANLAESGDGRRGGAARRARRLPRRHGAAGAAPRQRRRRAAARAGPDGRRPRRDRHPHRRRRGPRRPARAARRRPARRLSPTPTWPAAPSPAPAGSSPSTRSSPARRRCRRRARRRRLRREGGHDHEPRGSGDDGRPEGRPWPARPGPDWMIAAELAERLGPRRARRRLASVDAITDAIAATVPAYAGATRAGAASTPATACSPCPAADRRRRSRHRRHGAPDRISYDYRLVVTRQLYDRAVGTAHSPIAGPARRRGAAHIHPLDLERVGVAEGTEVRIVGPAGLRRAARSSPTPGVPRVPSRCRSTSPGHRRARSSTPPRRPPTSAWSGL